MSETRLITEVNELRIGVYGLNIELDRLREERADLIAELDITRASHRNLVDDNTKLRTEAMGHSAYYVMAERLLAERKAEIERLRATLSKVDQIVCCRLICDTNTPSQKHALLDDLTVAIRGIPTP